MKEQEIKNIVSFIPYIDILLNVRERKDSCDWREQHGKRETEPLSRVFFLSQHISKTVKMPALSSVFCL